MSEKDEYSKNSAVLDGATPPRDDATKVDGSDADNVIAETNDSAVESEDSVEMVEEPPRNAVCRYLCCESCGWTCCAPGSRPYSLMMKWHLPVGLILLVILGIAWPVPGAWLSINTPLSTIGVVIIFFLSGVKLKTEEIVTALKSPWAAIYGTIAILGLTPLLGFPLALIPLDPPELSLGVALFMAMPTTISTAVLFTGSANGNQALALFFSVVTNILGTVTVPFFVAAFVTTGGGASIDAVSLLVNLLLTVLLPVVVGVLLRRFVSQVPPLVRDESDFIKVTSSLLLIMIPWMKVSESRDRLLLLDGGSTAACVGISIASHIFLLLFNGTVIAFLPNTGMPERKAVWISSSQKTLAIAVAVIDQIPPEAADLGILAVVVILSHFVQSIIDAFIAARIANLDALPWSKPPTPQENNQEEQEEKEPSPQVA